MALAYFDYATIDEFIHAFNFEGMEPLRLSFTTRKTLKN